MNSEKREKKGFQQIPVNKCVEPKEVARMEISNEEIEKLAASISETGSLQPIEVVKDGEGFEIVFGHRRWLAHKYLEKEKIWARVVDLSKDEILIRRATENISRENLSPVEEGANYEAIQKQFGIGVDKIARRVGQKASRVKRMLDIMRMPVSFQKAIHKGTIKPTTAEALWRCDDDSHREYLLELAVEHGITTLVAQQWVNDHKKKLRDPSVINNEGGVSSSPMESKPNYMTCDVCKGPENISNIKNLVLCETCYKSISSA